MCDSVGTYIEAMRQRHPRLSMRQMSLGAGLSESVIGQLVRGEVTAKPATLKQICDAWGNDEDYLHLMELAGHPIPDTINLDDPLLSELIREFSQLSDRDQRRAVAIIKTLSGQGAYRSTQGGPDDPEEEVPTNHTSGSH